MSRILILIVVAIIGSLGYAGSSYLPGMDSDSTQSASSEEGCKTVKGVVTVELDRDRYPLTLDHLEDSIREGHPSILHIDREGADENREEALAGIPTKEGFDRDEAPMALSSEGGEGASVRYVPFADNRGAGSSVGNQLSPYCSGQAFQIIGV